VFSIILNGKRNAFPARPKPPNQVACILLYVIIPALPPLYLRGQKVPTFHSEIDQSLHIDIMKRFVNTDAYPAVE